MITGFVGLGVVPLVLGILGLRRTRENGTRGRGMAITGIVFGSMGIAAGVLVTVSLVMSWGLLTRSAAAASGSGVPTTKSYTLSAPAKLTADEVNATADLVRARLGSTPAKVTVKGQAIHVTFDSAPSQATLTAMTAPSDLTMRPVLIVGDASTPIEVAPTSPASGPSSPSDVAYYVTAQVQAAYNALTCPSTTPSNAAKDTAMVACGTEGSGKLILGPAEVDGT
ncbi:MAG: hypothetical protein B7X40_10410, partial [Cellulomonas sp. 14-74-6]